MPTFNQLVRKGRQTSTKKSNSPALLKGMNYLEGGTTRERNAQIGGHRAGDDDD